MIIFLIMIFLSFLQVILREFFSTGMLWADIFLRHLVLWVGFLGAAIAVSSSKHFVIEALKKYFPDRVKRSVEILTLIFSMGTLVFLCKAAIKFIRDDIQHPSMLFEIMGIEVPSFWMNLIIPVGFALLFIHYLIFFVLSFSQRTSSFHSHPTTGGSAE